MAKLSKLDKVIASMKAESYAEWQAAVAKNAIFKSLIDQLEAQKTQPAKKPAAARKVRKSGAVEPTQDKDVANG